MLTYPGASWHSEQEREGATRHHPGDGPAAFGRREQARCHHRDYRPEQGMGQGHHHPGGHEPPVVRGNGGGQAPGDEDRQRAGQQEPTGNTAGQMRQRHRRRDDHQGVDRHQQASGRQRGAQARRHDLQQADREVLACYAAERRGCERHGRGTTPSGRQDAIWSHCRISVTWTSHPEAGQVSHCAFR